MRKNTISPAHLVLLEVTYVNGQPALFMTIRREIAQSHCETVTGDPGDSTI